MDDLQRAAAKFRGTQEALKTFIEENCEYTIDGLEFVSPRSREELDRELARLRQEHDKAGRAWAACLGSTDNKGVGSIGFVRGSGSVNAR